MAVLLQAGLDGIRNRITPPAAVDRNIYVMDEEEKKLHISKTYLQLSIMLSRNT